jgi:uncharacterized membrane protein YqiK
MLFWLTFIQSLPTLPAALPGPNSSESVPGITLSDRLEDAEAEFVADASLQRPIATVHSSPSQPVMGIVGNAPIWAGGVVAIIILLLLAVWAYTRVYVITPTNEAFVKTGGVFVKRKMVILNGGCVVLPGFHELTRVPLREISIDVERTGKLAVRTKDYLRADMRVTFYVCITPSQEGKITPDDIKNALEKRADDAIRAAAKTKNLAEIDSDKLGFAQEVLNLVQQDLGKVGLTLNNIAISEVHESDTYDENNFFDAQGVRLRTETIQRSIQQKREVELTTRVAIEQKELDAEKRSLHIVQEKEAARLEQQLQVEATKAQREREIEESRSREAAMTQRTRILQEQSVEEEEIRRKLAVQQSQIEANIELEERNKKFKVAQAAQQQDSDLADINRQKTVDSERLEAQVRVADAERLARLAQEDVAIAISKKRQESFMADAERARAEASVSTATEVEVAERQKRLAVLAAQQEAEERRIADQNIVEIDVFRRRRQAEIAKQAAELESESIRTLAEAERFKALAEAEGLQAKLAARNVISNPNLTAEVISTIWPDLAERLPEVLQALAPQPGVLGDARIYAFPGANGNGSNGVGDVNKLLLSTSGLALINTLLDEGKLGTVIQQIRQLLKPDNNGSPSGLSSSGPSSNTDAEPPIIQG